MKPVTRYSIAEVDADRHKAQLALNGAPLPQWLDGALLEAQFDNDGETLLWMTEDSPYEEGLHIYLLGPTGAVLDAMEAGAPFSPGILKMKDTGGRWLEFEFFETGALYRLQVEDRFGLRWPATAGFKYKHPLAKHRLVVKVICRGGE
jgi:hypothetical protein